MTSVPGAAFRTHLETLDRETATGFVAAVYEARGWEVDRDSDDLLATPPQADRPRRLVVHMGTGDRDDAATGSDAAVVDAATLHELVAYALPADDRRRLCRDFLDRDPESFGGGDDATTADTGGDDRTAERPLRPAATAGSGEHEGTPADGERAGSADEPAARTDSPPVDGPDGPEWLGRVAVVGLALSLALGGLVTATGPAGVAVDSPAVVLQGNGTAAAESTATFPRGVGASGVTDASALADAHEATLSSRSYRLTITYREFKGEELRGVAHERAVVVARGRYRSRVRRLGSLRHESSMIASGSTYANGSAGYVRTDDGVRKQTEIRSPLVPTSAGTIDFADRTERAVGWYLSVNESRIVGRTERNGTTVYQLTFAGDPWPESRNVTGWARVGEDGLVRELHREYSPTTEPGVRIEVTIRIVPGPETVTRPEWVPAEADSSWGYEHTIPSRVGSVTDFPTSGGS